MSHSQYHPLYESIALAFYSAISLSDVHSTGVYASCFQESDSDTTSTLQTSHCSLSQRHSVRLNSGNCKDQWNKPEVVVVFLEASGDNAGFVTRSIFLLEVSFWKKGRLWPWRDAPGQQLRMVLHLNDAVLALKDLMSANSVTELHGHPTSSLLLHKYSQVSLYNISTCCNWNWLFWTWKRPSVI